VITGDPLTSSQVADGSSTQVPRGVDPAWYGRLRSVCSGEISPG